MNIFKELYQYRELLKTNVKKEIRGKYKGSWLGVLWTFLNPLLQLLVYSFVFPYILRVEVEHYTIFMMVALVPWTFFTTAIQIGASSIIGEAGIIKKVYFPREIIPISVVISALVNFLITCIIMFLFILISGVGFTPYVLLFPVIVLIQTIFTLGFTFILSAVTVYVQDIAHFVSIVIMLMFYATPIVYNGELLPAKFQWIITLNPMAQVINAYRDILFYHKTPDYNGIAILALISLAILFVGYEIFKKLKRNFVEEL
ncbi:MAG: ABC transporter permease [Bacilli bacterium]|nr:ABC transporter permease [Bacilli bacterium]